MHNSWYPGHMARALSDIEKFIALVDVVVEVVDSRVPISSRDLILARVAAKKARILVLNKADLADEQATRQWIEYFSGVGIKAVAINAKSSGDIKMLKDVIKQVEGRHKGRKIKNVIVVGIPNVGKSTIINALIKDKRAKVGARPGVTRRVGWFRVDELQILDTPGILKPNIKNTNVKLLLACIGAIDDVAFDMEEMAAGLLSILQARYGDRLASRYGIPVSEQPTDGYRLLEAICINKHWLRSGGLADVHRGAAAVIDDFRKGAMGPITLEMPPVEG